MYFAFDRLAAALGSTRGEAGLIACMFVVALAALAEHWLTRAPWLFFLLPERRERLRADRASA
jgi:hypothetical protein